jgi:hypothetical protein
MYWIYDIPNWLLGLLTVSVFLLVSLLGLVVVRPLVRRLVGGSSAYNDVVSYIFAGIGVFYGLALGLLAVGTWEDFTAIDGQISTEAAQLAGLYRDLDGYDQPMRGRLEAKLRNYVQIILERDWPAHQRGEAPEEGTLLLDEIENDVMVFEPKTERERIAHAVVLESLKEVFEQRRLRLQSVGTGLPLSVWAVVLIGAALTISLTYLFWVDKFTVHAILVGFLATFIALLIFLTAAMDNPFRGEFSTSPDAFRSVFDNVMNTKAAPKTP